MAQSSRRGCAHAGSHRRADRPAADRHGGADRDRHVVPDAVLPRRPVLRRPPWRCGDRRRQHRGHPDLRDDGSHPDAGSGHGDAGLARGGTQGSDGSQSHLQSVGRAVGDLRGADARRGTAVRRRLRAGHGGRWRGGRGRRRVPVRVHPRPRAAVRADRARLGAARHRHRQTDHDGADADGDREHDSRAGADRRLGHSPSAGHGWRRARNQHCDRLRRGAAVDLFRAPRALREAAPWTVAAARGRHPPHFQRRPARRWRVPHDVRDPWLHLLGDPRLRPRCPGGLRHRHADHAGAVPAGHGAGVRRLAGRGSEFRGAPLRARARRRFGPPRC